MASFIEKPTGCCMNAFAAMMKYADMIVPALTHQMLARCSPFGKRSQPKIQTPMNAASKKKARIPSSARGAPKTSPTKRE